MRIKSFPAAITAFATLAASTATAAIVEDIGQRASSEFGNRIAAYATNGAGLIGDFHTENPNGAMWLSTFGDTAGSFEIDLGAVYAINSIRVWNYNEDLPDRPDLLERGVKTANIDIGLTPSGYSTLISDRVFNKAPGTTDTDFSETINLLGTVGRFIRLDILTNYSANPEYTGLSEIQVDATFLSGQKPLAASIFGVSSTIGGTFDRAPEHTVDYNGVFSKTHSILPDGNMWLADFQDLAPTITFDLGSIQSLSNMLFWNYNETLPNRTDLLNRGIAKADILLSNDGSSFSLFASGVDFTMAPGNNTDEFAQNVSLIGATARYVQIQVISNYGNPEYTGISEVQFFAIPEPSAALLVAAAPLATLLSSRRRRSPLSSF